MAETSLKQALQYGQQILRAAGLESADSDAQWLLLHVLQAERSVLFSRPEQVLEDNALQTYKKLLLRRAAHEPLAYITGEAGFWNLLLQVSPDVLIPRPETELLVEQALQRLPETNIHLADLGTGSGAIALALASERPLWQVHAVDNSAAALAVAKNNAQRLGLTQVQFSRGEWLQGFAAQSLHAVVANPPYIAEDDEHLQQDGLPFEPQTALTADNEGYADLFAIAGQAESCLKPGGLLMLEHGYQQAEALQRHLAELGYGSIESLPDLAGHLRVTLARRAA